MKKFVTIAALGAVVALSGCSTEKSDSSKEIEAKVKCQTAIMKQVAGTDYDDFSDMRVTKFGDGWKVSGAVQGTNAFGGPAMTRFYCDTAWDDEANAAKVTNATLNGR